MIVAPLEITQFI